MRRPITNFKPHVNDVNEVIDADHLNQLQVAINQTELKQAQGAKQQFVNEVLFALSNSLSANAVQFLSDENSFGQTVFPSSGFTLDPDEQGLTLANGLYTASFKTNKLTGHLHNSKLNQFTLIADCYVPVGAGVEYYLTINGGRVSQRIHPNDAYSFNQSPLQLSEAVEDYQLTVIMKENQAKQSPVLYQLALLFHDEAVDEHFEF